MHLWAAFICFNTICASNRSKFYGHVDIHTGVLDWAATEEADLQSILDEEDNVKTRIIFAREELKVSTLSTDICEKHPRPFGRVPSRMLWLLCVSNAVCENLAFAESHRYLFVALSLYPLPPTGRQRNYLPTRSSTCARRLVVRKPKDSARKSSRVKWQELPQVSPRERPKSV